MAGGTGADVEATVLCMKWGPRYGPEYVNRLYGMVARHLWRPVRFVCLTDDARGIRPEVTCHPIPQLPLPPPGSFSGAQKLAAFSPDVVPLLGETVLFLDLDIVVVGALDAFFEQPGDFLIIRDWYFRPFARIGNSSAYRFWPRRSSDVFERYCRDPERVARRFRTEQEYLSRYLNEYGALRFWPKGWCASFKHDCIPAWPWRLWQAPAIPDGCRIVVFHGEPKPPQALAGGVCERGQYLAAPWIGEHWKE